MSAERHAALALLLGLFGLGPGLGWSGLVYGLAWHGEPAELYGGLWREFLALLLLPFSALPGVPQVGGLSGPVLQSLVSGLGFVPLLVGLGLVGLRRSLSLFLLPGGLMLAVGLWGEAVLWRVVAVALLAADLWACHLLIRRRW